MKQRSKEQSELQKEIKFLSKIDNLSSSEIEAGNEIDHDGVEISINGSDIKDFPEEQQQQTLSCQTEVAETTESTQDANENPEDSNENVSMTEPGEISSSEDEAEVQAAVQKSRVASKVVKIPNKPLPQSQNRFQKFQHRKDDPDFTQFQSEMVDKKIAGKNTSEKQSKGGGKTIRDSDETISKEQNANSQNNNDQGNVQPRVFKSSSDTTLYTAVLKKISNSDASLIEKISNFVESITLEDKRHGAGHHDNSPSTPARDVRQVERGESSGTQRSFHQIQDNQPDKRAEDLIIQSEKFKAKVQAPKGNYSNYQNMLMPYDYEKLRSKFAKPEGLGPIDSEILFLCNFDQDDEFFHITSQIEPNLRQKIEKGEYIELERLLPKDRNAGRNDEINKQLYQLITQGTSSYLEAPFPKTGKINNIRKWDEAFRVYAAIYTNANPERASEIWQYVYVYVIHTAASANAWENVYFYDINFRELMASKAMGRWKSNAAYKYLKN